MSESDSFLSEVTEEVRRDKMIATLRKYGWIIAAVVVVIVGAAGYSEWSKSAARTTAEARGDALIDALRANGTEERLGALEAVTETDPSVLSQFQLAAAQLENGDVDDASATLQVIASNSDFSEIYRDVARLKLVSLPGGDISDKDRMAMLAGLASEGHPLRSLAIEQRALLHIRAGDVAAAIEDFSVVYADENVQQTTRARVGQMITGLGGQLPDLSAASQSG